ncbi:TPA: hypothetical protein N0F65_008531 [Lagenidium giganteum]|uniref:FYVE-type domain-containing protein n=1 Tax=Lagenidium giganteum TaxID=4803 RepID=A0AAV2Z6B0_9STRA|nr:TPA: hypothetical protein N0F65_008531 [Lagenidium giganteum]
MAASGINLPTMGMPSLKKATSMPNAMVKSVKVPTLNAKSALMHHASAMRSYVSSSLSARWQVKNDSPVYVEPRTPPSNMSKEQDNYEAMKSTPLSPKTPPGHLNSSASMAVVAVMAVTCSGNDLATRFGKLPRTLSCCVRFGDAIKTGGDVSLACNKKLIFNDKFIFEQPAFDDRTGDVAIELISSVVGGRVTSAFKETIGELVIPLNQELAQHRTGQPIRRSVLMVTGREGAKIEMHYALHRIPIESPAAEAASSVLSRSPSSLDEDGDMAEFVPECDDAESSFSSTSTMDSDFEVPTALANLRQLSSQRVSAKLSQYLTSMTSINERESMRYSVVTASKWKKMGYHPYKPDASGYTALHRAAKKGEPSVISSLLVMYDGKQIDLAAMQSRRQGQIALHIAAKYARLEAVRVLAAPEFRSLVNKPDTNGNTPLHFAATSNTPEAASVVALLLMRGADPTLKSRTGVFPIIAHLLTAQEDDPEITKLLLKHGCDPNTLDNEGNSALHLAVQNGLWKIASCLVHQQASMTIRNHDGLMVLDILTPKQLSWLARFISHPPEWVPYSSQKSCMVCTKRFSMLVRRHHCRLCGRICCGPCSKYKRALPFAVGGLKETKHHSLMKVCSTCINVRAATEDDKSWTSTTTTSTDRLVASDIMVDYDY